MPPPFLIGKNVFCHCFSSCTIILTRIMASLRTEENNQGTILRNLHPLTPELKEDHEDLLAREAVVVQGAFYSGSSSYLLMFLCMGLSWSQYIKYWCQHLCCSCTRLFEIVLFFCIMIFLFLLPYKLFCSIFAPVSDFIFCCFWCKTLLREGIPAEFLERQNYYSRNHGCASIVFWTNKIFSFLRSKVVLISDRRLLPKFGNWYCFLPFNFILKYYLFIYEFCQYFSYFAWFCIRDLSFIWCIENKKIDRL